MVEVPLLRKAEAKVRFRDHHDNTSRVCILDLVEDSLMEGHICRLVPRLVPKSEN